MKEKDFKTWHSLKTKIQKEEKILYFREREIWFCTLGENVGKEQGGKGKEFLRPVLILKKLSKDLFFGIPLSKTVREGSFYFNFNFSSHLKSSAILAQTKVIDKKRLKDKIGKMPKEDFLKLKKKLRKLLGI